MQSGDVAAYSADVHELTTVHEAPHDEHSSVPLDSVSVPIARSPRSTSHTPPAARMSERAAQHRAPGTPDSRTVHAHNGVHSKAAPKLEQNGRNSDIGHSAPLHAQPPDLGALHECTATSSAPGSAERLEQRRSHESDPLDQQ